MEYLKPAFCVFAALGLHLVEPFYSITISTGTTHSKLKVFYQTLHDQLNTEITADPWFDCINLELFKDGHQSYNENVVLAVKRMSAQYLNDCLKLVNIILPQLKTVLAAHSTSIQLT